MEQLRMRIKEFKEMVSKLPIDTTVSSTTLHGVLVLIEELAEEVRKHNGKIGYLIGTK